MPPRIDRLKPVLLLGDGGGQIDDELLSSAGPACSTR